MWNCQTGHFSGSPGSPRRTRAGSVTMPRIFFSTTAGSSRISTALTLIVIPLLYFALLKAKAGRRTEQEMKP